MKNIILDNEEQELLDAFEAGEFHSVLTPERKQFIESSAQQTCQLNQRVNINVSQSDLIRRDQQQNSLIQSLIEGEESGISDKTMDDIWAEVKNKHSNG